jgi:OmpA-OmpF porin, OOP family
LVGCGIYFFRLKETKASGPPADFLLEMLADKIVHTLDPSFNGFDWDSMKGYSIMRRQSGITILGVMITAILLAACVSAPLKVEPIAKTENPAALMENLGKGLLAARQNRVDLFSPTWFSAAQASYTKARQGIEQGTALAGILENIATGQAQLQQAQNNADRFKSTLADVVESRDAAIKAHANKYEKEFNKLEGKFRELSEAVEENDTGYVHDKRKVLDAAYRDLELRAIKGAALAEARKLMAAAEDEDMQDVAPKSFLTARNKLADAEAVIARDRYDKVKIDVAAREAEFYVQRLHGIAQASVQLDPMEPEDIALWMERYFTEIIVQLKEIDRRNLSFDAQQEAVLSAITSLQRARISAASRLEARSIESEKLKDRIGDLEGRTYQERLEKERLAAEKRFNELYTQVQGYFSPDEAEVYKKAQHLVIRLKAIQFPVGQAVIMPNNYPLLTTVQKAIYTFGKPDVVIEGHTDSTGSEPLNQQLSQKRAESVKQYLVYNGTLPAGKIAAVGYGSARPLASNATAQGRAVNRRIDLIIKPVKGR